MEDKEKQSPKKETAHTINWGTQVETWKTQELQAWRQKHFDWYKALSFHDGNHYSYYDPATGHIKNLNVGVTVPLCYSVIRTVTNNVIKLKPKWTFYPTSGDTASEDNLLKLAKLMDKIYDELEVKKILREAVKTGLLYSAAPVFVGWDASKNSGKGGLVLRAENPYYILPEHTATSKEDCKRIIRIVRKSIADVRNNDNYPKEITALLKTESKMGGTPIFETVITKNNKINDVKGSTSDGEEEDAYGDVFLTECYVKEHIEEQYEDVSGEMRTRKVPRIRLVCACQNHVLYNEVTDLEDYPFEFYYSDKSPFSFYGQGWMKNLIPLNQVINKHETHKLDYIEKLNKGAFIVQKGTKVVTSSQNGVTTYTIDGKYQPDGVKQLQMQALPSTIDTSLESMRNYMKEVGGMSDVMRGEAPGANISNAAIESLIEQSGNTTIELKENLEEFITKITQQILWNIAKYQMTSETLTLDNGEQGTETLNYVSQESPIALNLDNEDEADAGDLVKISTDNRFKLTMDSDLANTTQGRQETLDKLFMTINPADGMPAIPLETYLEGYKYGNVKEILEKRELEITKMRELEAQKAQQEAMIEMDKEEHKQVTSIRLNQSINYKDAPEDIQRQMEEQAGYQASNEVPTDPTSVTTEEQGDPMKDYANQVMLRKFVVDNIGTPQQEEAPVIE